MCIHPTIHNKKNGNKDEIFKLADSLQSRFPSLDVWYVAAYSSDESSQEAEIQIINNSGHIGIGKRLLDDSQAQRVYMKVYNVDSDEWTFFFDHQRLAELVGKINPPRKVDFNKCQPDVFEKFLNKNYELVYFINKGVEKMIEESKW